MLVKETEGVSRGEKRVFVGEDLWREFWQGLKLACFKKRIGGAVLRCEEKGGWS